MDVPQIVVSGMSRVDGRYHINPFQPSDAMWASCFSSVLNMHAFCPLAPVLSTLR